MRLATCFPSCSPFAPALIRSAGQADSPVHTVNALGAAGEPKYGPDFKHFDWVNPDAPRGGEIHLATVGSFDTFNPIPSRGVAASGIGALFETLMGQSKRAGHGYGLIAESAEIPRIGPGSLSPASRSTLAGRQAHHRRRRGLHLQHPA